MESRLFVVSEAFHGPFNDPMRIARGNPDNKRSPFSARASRPTRRGCSPSRWRQSDSPLAGAPVQKGETLRGTHDANLLESGLGVAVLHLLK